MKLTAKQFKALSPYESHFEKAVRATWTPYPGREGIDIMHETWCAVTGQTRVKSYSCGACILDLVTDMGKIYLADKAEKERKSSKNK